MTIKSVSRWDLEDDSFWQPKLLVGPEPWGPHGKMSDWQLRFGFVESYVPQWGQNVKSSSLLDGMKKRQMTCKKCFVTQSLANY